MSARKFWLQEENYKGDKPILINIFDPKAEVFPKNHETKAKILALMQRYSGFLINNTAGMGELEKKAAECENVDADEKPEQIELSQYMRNDFDQIEFEF